MSVAQAFDDEGLRGRIDAWLHALRLPGAAARFRSPAEETRAGEESLRFLEGVLTAELESREIRRYERNLRAARFPMVKELGGFDFSAIPSLPKARVNELVACRFVTAHESVILVGNPGTGKTHVLIGLGLEAIRKGFRVRFVTAGALVNELLLARAELRVPKLPRFYGIFDLLSIPTRRRRKGRTKPHDLHHSPWEGPPGATPYHQGQALAPSVPWPPSR